MAYYSRWLFCSETEPECPKSPRVRNYPALPYYSMGLAIWTDCIPKRDIYIYIQTYNFDTVLRDYMPRAKALGNY